MDIQKETVCGGGSGSNGKPISVDLQKAIEYSQGGKSLQACGFTGPEFARASGISDTTARTRIRGMIAEGKLRRVRLRRQTVQGMTTVVGYQWIEEDNDDQ